MISLNHVYSLKFQDHAIELNKIGKFNYKVFPDLFDIN